MYPAGQINVLCRTDGRRLAGNTCRISSRTVDRGCEAAKNMECLLQAGGSCRQFRRQQRTEVSNGGSTRRPAAGPAAAESATAGEAATAKEPGQAETAGEQGQPVRG